MIPYECYYLFTYFPLQLCFAVVGVLNGSIENEQA
jgi:hypothetical protein